MPPATVTVCGIADPGDANFPANPSTFLTDLMRLFTSGSGFGLVDDQKAFDTGTIQRGLDVMSQVPYPGGTLASTTDPPVTMTIPLLLKGTSVDDEESYLWALAEALSPPDDWGVLVFQPKGSSTRSYFDFLGSPELAGLFRGQDRGMYRVIEQLRDPDGYPLKLLCQPWPRRDPVTSLSAVAFSNKPKSNYAKVSNAGSAPALGKLTVTPEAGSELTEIVASVRSTGDLASFEASYSFDIVGAGVNLDVDTSSVVDATVDGGHAAKTTFASTDAWKKRWHTSITPSVATGIKGRFAVYVGVKTDGPGIFEVQLKYAEGSVPAGAVKSLPIVRFEGGDLETYHWVALDLGEIANSGTTLLVEAHARRVQDELDFASTANLYWAFCWFASTDPQFMKATVPPEGGPVRWRGKDLATLAGTPTVDNGNVNLNSTSDQVANPDGYEALAAGRYMVDAHVTLTNKLKSAIVLGYLQVRQQDTNTVITRHALRCRKQRTTRRHRKVHFKAVAGKSYRFEVIMTADPSGAGAKIAVHEVSLHIRNYTDSGGSMVLDGLVRDAQLVVSAQRTVDLALDGRFLEFPPGDSDLVVLAFEAHETGYDHTPGKVDAAAGGGGGGNHGSAGGRRKHRHHSKLVPLRNFTVTLQTFPRDRRR